MDTDRYRQKQIETGRYRQIQTDIDTRRKNRSIQIGMDRKDILQI